MKPKYLFLISGILYTVSGGISLYQIANAEALDENTTQTKFLTNLSNLTSAMGGVVGGVGLYLQFKGKL